MSEERLRLAHSLVGDEPDEAMRICNEVLNDHMEDDLAQKALFMQGYIMMEAERYGLAYNIYKRCAQLNPRISEIYSNMGMCLEEYDPEKAKRLFQKAYKLDNGNARALANEGLMQLHSGEPEKCITLSRRALAINPDMRAARHNMGLAQLMLRKWRDGWENFYDTIGVKHREGRDYGVPDWNGEPGKIVVYGEQGVGDEIMFASCLNELSKTNEIVLDTDSRLEGLFSRTFDFPVYGTRFMTETPLLDDHQPDYQLAIGQLPYFFRRDGEFPGTPYLKPDPERCLQWRALFDTFKGKKIGIAIHGGLKNTGQSRRTLQLKDLEPILNNHDTFICVDYKPIEGLEEYGIKQYPRATAKGGNIDDLAAIVHELDYVICPCTTLVYVAGAMGIPCDVFVPKHPGYRYHMEGQFPWYESVRLIRQKGTWRQTVQDYARESIAA